MEQISLQWNAGPAVLTVSELTEAIRGLLDTEFGNIWVSGEISGCRVPSSGHYYFKLKDRDAQIDAVCYRSAVRFLKFKPQDGVAVLARGRLDVYPPRGSYQLVVEALEPQGHGALQFAFEQLKKKLAAEGLFDAGRKRPLPNIPMRIGLVTSPTGAVVQDILNILSRRFPGLHIRLYPALVQGEGSVEAVCRGLEHFSADGWAQVVIVARGGGSLEDLWTFNEEAVARAIAASRVPVISAIGHETDFTIADFVADLRAPTPSAAAELVVCEREKLLDAIRVCRGKLEQAARYRLVRASHALQSIGVERATAIIQRMLARRMQRTDDLEYTARERWGQAQAARRRKLQEMEATLRSRDVRFRMTQAARRLEAARAAMTQAARARVAGSRARLDALASERLARAIERERRALQALRHRTERAAGSLEYGARGRLGADAGRLERITGTLAQLSPLRILERGYAIVQRADGRVVKAPADAPAGTELRLRLAEGRAGAISTGPVPDSPTPDDSSGLPS